MRIAHLVITSAVALSSSGMMRASECSVSGEVFAVDPAAQTVLVRDDAGYLKSVDVDNRTAFTFTSDQARVAPDLQSVNSGDLVCVEFRGAGKQVAERVTDAPRVDLQRKQRDWLLRWNKSVVRGRIDKVLEEPKRLLVNTGESVVEVAVPRDTSIRLYPTTAKALEDGRDGSFSDLHPGMAASIRLADQASSGRMAARSVYTGGVTSVAGVVTEVDALGETVSIRELGTGRRIAVTVPASRVYRALAPSLATPESDSPAHVLANHRQLKDIGFSELQNGDWVLATGMPSGDSSRLTGFAMITRFGYFGSEMQSDLESGLRF
jgi:hypothetical protein